MWAQPVYHRTGARRQNEGELLFSGFNSKKYEFPNAGGCLSWALYAFTSWTLSNLRAFRCTILFFSSVKNGTFWVVAKSQLTAEEDKTGTNFNKTLVRKADKPAAELVEGCGVRMLYL